MARIIGIGTAVPPHVILQEQASQFATMYFKRRMAHMERLTTVFNHAQIDQRHLVVPYEWFESDQRTFTERNNIYLKEATELSQHAVLTALDHAGIAPSEVDNLILISSTGIATPSLDARLINLLGMRPDVRRVPIWGLGCAGGVAGLARASEMARAYPESITVVVAVETCSLTFQFGDYSKKNFIATALFGDGAAAVVVSGAERHVSTSPIAAEILDSQSTLWANSLRVMGWDVVETGFEVLFGVEIPRYIADQFRPEVDCFLGKHGLNVDQIDHLVLHPGGAKVIDAYRTCLNVDDALLTPARQVLRSFGNMSSPTVLFVLDYILKQDVPSAGQYGLAAALGPGFSAEQVLIRF